MEIAVLASLLLVIVVLMGLLAFLAFYARSSQQRNHIILSSVETARKSSGQLLSIHCMGRDEPPSAGEEANDVTLTSSQGPAVHPHFLSEDNGGARLLPEELPMDMGVPQTMRTSGGYSFGPDTTLVLTDVQAGFRGLIDDK